MMIQITAELLMAVGGAVAFMITLYWVRRRELREKYAVGWIVLAFLLLLIGLFPSVLKTIAEASRLSYPSAVLFVALTLIYLYSFSVSVSLSNQYRRNIRLTQQLALLEERVRQLEQKLNTPPAPPPGR